MGRRRGPRIVAESVAPAAAANGMPAAVPAFEQLRRAAWMTIFPTAIGLCTLLFHPWGVAPATALARGSAILLAASGLFFVALSAASLLGAVLGGPALALRTRTPCPACGRTLWVIQTRCTACDAPVPVSRAAFPTFAYTACAYALFQIFVFVALRRWDSG